jgi:uncharacterized protein
VSVLDAAASNLTNPTILAFALGVIAALIRADLKLPEPVTTAISMYLLVAIGLKGGVSLSESNLGDVALPLVGAMALGVTTPFIAYGAMRRIGRFSVVDSAALAAHYGSVSLVTFAASLTFLADLNVSVEGYMAALLTVLEVPAIVVALVLARRRSPGTSDDGLRGVIVHVTRERSVVLLLGGLLIGWITGADGYADVAGFFDTPFKGVLMLFLLHMGMVAGGYLSTVRHVGPRLIALGIGIPVLHGLLGAAVGSAVGLSVGGATVLACLAASASYIAAPAAVRLALPDANPGYYLTAAIAITFPWNLTVGIPLYYEMAQLVT